MPEWEAKMEAIIDETLDEKVAALLEFLHGC